MAKKKSFAKALNEQISNEFAASQQYVAMAVYYDSETLPRLAAFFYRQALEEREHAMMMIQYLLDVDEEVEVPDVKSQPTKYEDGITSCSGSSRSRSSKLPCWATCSTWSSARRTTCCWPRSTSPARASARKATTRRPRLLPAAIDLHPDRVR
jgi:hypothetical protein